jgi:hypothetical protein
VLGGEAELERKHKEAELDRQKERKHKETVEHSETGAHRPEKVREDKNIWQIKNARKKVWNLKREEDRESAPLQTLRDVEVNRYQLESQSWNREEQTGN